MFYSIDIYVEYDTSVCKGHTDKTTLDTKWFDYETRLLVLMRIVSVLVFISFRCWTRQSSNDLIPLWLYNLHSFCGSSAQKVLRDNSATSRLFFSSSIYPGRGLPTYHLPLCYCLCMKTLPFNWHLFWWREQPHRFCDFIRKVSTSPSLHFANRSATEICRRLYIHILSEGSPCGKRSIWFMCVRYWGPF